MNEKVFLQDLGTIASYYPFSLCLSILLRVVASRTLVLFGAQPLWANFSKRKEIRCEFSAMRDDC
jgi:hypothetical protein